MVSKQNLKIIRIRYRKYLKLYPVKIALIKALEGFR